MGAGWWVCQFEKAARLAVEFVGDVLKAHSGKRDAVKSLMSTIGHPFWHSGALAIRT